MALRKKVVCLLAMALALLMLCSTAMADNFSFLQSRTENGKEYLAHPSSEFCSSAMTTTQMVKLRKSRASITSAGSRTFFCCW